MKMLRWMCGHTIGTIKFENEDIREKMDVASVMNKLKKRCIDALMRRRKRLVIVDTRRGKDKLKKYWRKAIRQNTIQFEVTEDKIQELGGYVLGQKGSRQCYRNVFVMALVVLLQLLYFLTIYPSMLFMVFQLLHDHIQYR